MNRGEYTSAVQDLAGLDVEDDEVVRLVEEGRYKLLTKSDYRRARIVLAQSGADYSLWTAPTRLHRFLRVSVDGQPAVRSDAESIEIFTTEPGATYSLPSGTLFYYLTEDDEAALTIGLYPVPTAEPTVTAQVVQGPEELPDDDTEDPDVPANWQQAVVHYAAATAYAFQDDADDLHSYHMSLFDRAVEEMRLHRNSMHGRGPYQARIVGAQIA